MHCFALCGVDGGGALSTQRKIRTQALLITWEKKSVVWGAHYTHGGLKEVARPQGRRECPLNFGGPSDHPLSTQMVGPRIRGNVPGPY